MLIAMASQRLQIGMLLFPNLTQLDLTGPHEVLTRLPESTVHLVAKSRDLVGAESGMAIAPTATFSEVPDVDVLFVPGGYGQIAAIDDRDTMRWIADVGARARWVTSVCTGALLLGAAGLLRGYRATTHWAFHELLPLVDALPVHERVVIDRNRITAGGVTAGIDFGLALLETLHGRELAQSVQLQLEYDPAPPFAGHPSRASAEVVADARARTAARLDERRAQLERLRLRSREPS